MTRAEFTSIPLLKFGNEITIKGLVMSGPDRPDLLVYLPQEIPNEEDGVIFMRPSMEEWYQLQEQLDQNNVECLRNDQKVILRKGQRLLDQKIAWNVYRRDKYRCRYCGIDNVPLTVDHIITWETGGATHEDNLLTACKKCNKKRGNLDYGSWLQHKFYLEKSKFLTENQRKANETIIPKLQFLPRMKTQRNR